jgi:uncharacterized protein YndB with AHSA1/START domain
MTRFTLQQPIDASPEAIFRAFTTNAGWTEWFADHSDVDPEKTGRLYLWRADGFCAVGSFSAVNSPKRVELAFLYPEKASITIEIELGEPASRLHFEASGFPQAVWEEALGNLRAVLETGYDRRIYLRPMLGVLVDGLYDPESHAADVPVDYGIVIAGPVEGMGAADCGMQAGDVLVEVNGVQLRSYHQLHTAVAGLSAGDAVQVRWYRRGELFEAAMSLSGRPRPSLPETPADLAAEVQLLYDQLEAELEAVLEGVDEYAAGTRPGKNTWSAKESLANLILTERAAHFWLANTTAGRVYRNWSSNDPNLIASVLAVHSTIPQLLKERHRLAQQTIILLENLALDATAFRGAYHNIVTTFNQYGLPLHALKNIQQIKDSLAEATTAQKAL